MTTNEKYRVWQNIIKKQCVLTEYKPTKNSNDFLVTCLLPNQFFFKFFFKFF